MTCGPTPSTWLLPAGGRSGGIAIPDADLLLGAEVETLRVRGPGPASEPGGRHAIRFRPVIRASPDLDTGIRLVECGRPVRVIRVTMCIYDRANGQVRDPLELGTEQSRAGDLLTRVNDDHTVVAYDHRVGAHLVADGRVDVLGHLDDGRLEHLVALEQAPGGLALLGGGARDRQGRSNGDQQPLGP